MALIGAAVTIRASIPNDPLAWPTFCVALAQLAVALVALRLDRRQLRAPLDARADATGHAPPVRDSVDEVRAEMQALRDQLLQEASERVDAAHRLTAAIDALSAEPRRKPARGRRPRRGRRRPS